MDPFHSHPQDPANTGSSSNRRRRLLLALLAAPLSTFALAISETGGLRRWGSGEFRRWGFLVYDATLWAGDDPLRPPLALQLTYRRKIDGRDIAEASVKEIRSLGLADEATLKRWGEQMVGIFPNVKPGDSVVGHYQSGGARFTFNGELLGSVDEPAFARAFFAIWLDPKTSAPDLRAALLTRPASG